LRERLRGNDSAFGLCFPSGRKNEGEHPKIAARDRNRKGGKRMIPGAKLEAIKNRWQDLGGENAEGVGGVVKSGGRSQGRRLSA